MWSDASLVGSGAVLVQEGKPVAYTSRKFTKAGMNYTTTDQECLGIITAVKEWRCYLEGAKFAVYTDHKALTFLQDQKRDNVLSRRQTRWMEELAKFKYTIEYKEGKINIADPLSRIYEDEDIEIDINEERNPSISVLLASITTGIVKALRSKLYQAYKNTNFAFQATRLQLKLKNGLYYNQQDKIVVPADVELRKHILAQYHDHEISGHRGIKRTKEAISRTFAWAGLSADVAQYVNSCDQCQRNKASTSKPGGKLQSLEVPERPWSSVSLDFMGPLPETKNGYNAILVFVDRLTKLTYLCATSMTCKAEDVAKYYINRVFANGHGVPDQFVSDRDGRFTSEYWQEFTKILNIRLGMSTAFHPQTDGQTERMNRLVQETLRHYVNPAQDDWDEHLPLVQFAINDSHNNSIGTTPFRLNMPIDMKIPTDEALRSKLQANQDADRQAKKSKDQRFQCEAARVYAQEMMKRITRAKQLMSAAQSRQKLYADKKRTEVHFKKDMWVMLDTRNLKFKGPDQQDPRRNRGKLMPRFIGPFKIVKECGPAAMQLALPKEMSRIHPTFHVSLLKEYKPRDGKITTKPPPPTVLDGEEYYTVETIMDHRVRQQGKTERREFLIKWKDYTNDQNTWEKEAQLREQDDVSELIDTYLQAKNMPKVHVKLPNDKKKQYIDTIDTDGPHWQTVIAIQQNADDTAGNPPPTRRKRARFS